MWVDARSTPPRIGVVLAIDGSLFYSDGKPSDEIMKELMVRKDDQIMALKILAISTGSTYINCL